MEMQFREVSLERAEEGNIKLSVSSEMPVRTYGMIDNQFQEFYEILGHKENEINTTRMKDGLVMLDTHNGDQIGIASNTIIEDNKLYVKDIKWSSTERAQNIKTDVLDGVRKNVSVGYIPNTNAYEYVDEKDDLPVYRSTDWMPYEFSFVPVPADYNVGLNRSKENKQTKKEEIIMSEDVKKEPIIDVNEVKRQAREEAIKDESARVREILSLGKEHNREEEAQDAIGRGTDVNQFRHDILQSLKIEAAEAKTERANIGMSEKDHKRYSWRKAILSLVDDNVDAGFERELSEEVAKRTGKSASGIYVPYDVLTRDLSVGGTGSNVVDTELLTGSFIEQLRNRLVVANMGATMLTGLEGDVAIPKQTASATAYWIDTEGNAPTSESQPTLSQVTGSPKQLGAYTDITRKLLLQSSMDTENLVRNDLAAIIARAIDLAAINGTNASGQPKGLLNVTGVNDVTCTAAAPTWAQILEFESSIEADNADIGAFGWVTTPAIKAILKSTEKATNTAKFLMEDNEMNGYNVMVSNQIPDNHIIFGVWSQLVIGMWGGLDIMADPYTNSASGTLRITALQDVDVMVRHGQSFSYTDDITG